MTMGQIILIIMSLVLFMTATMNINRTFTLKAQELYSQHTDSNALALGQYLLEEAWTKKFDETAVDGKPESIPGGFTSVSSLGSDNEAYSGDSSNYDDVDDYNSMDTTINFAQMDYRVKGTVYYTDINGNQQGSRTNFKMVIFDISNPADDVSVSVRHIYSYIP